jgi:predicted  nucleic acid-binding Zn-ribbon protein
MQHMINRRAFSVVILLSSLLLAGCSGVFGESPGEQADRAINEANDAIADHNRLFDQARSTYTDVKQEIEAGNDPSAQQDRITEARQRMEEARSRLQDARDSLEGVNDLDVDQTVKRYASTLSDAMAAQISAEDREIEFYALLEEDPSLQDNREEAENLLQQVGDDYERAEQAYAEARELADQNPELIEATNGN